MFASHTWQLKTLIQCDVCFKFFPNAATLAKHQAAENQGEDRPGSRSHLGPDVYFLLTSIHTHTHTISSCRPGAAAHCPYCAAVLGKEELQEHISSQHQCGEALGCPLCSALCRSHTELQEHLMSAHVEQESAEVPPATSHTVRTHKTPVNNQLHSCFSLITVDFRMSIQPIINTPEGGPGRSHDQVLVQY